MSSPGPGNGPVRRGVLATPRRGGRALPVWFRFEVFQEWIDHSLNEALLRKWEAPTNGVGIPPTYSTLEAGYHEKGACLDGDSDGCVILDLFGGFDDRPGKVMRRPIKFSPVRSAVDYRRGQAEGHYRRLNRNVVSRNEADIRQPLRNLEVDAVANLDGCWQLVFRETKPEFIGLLAEAVEYLHTHQTAFMHQLGGARNSGGGIVDCELVNPLYEANEFHRIFNRSAGPSAPMEAKDEEWAEEYLPAFRTALTERVKEEG